MFVNLFIASFEDFTSIPLPRVLAASVIGWLTRAQGFDRAAGSAPVIRGTHRRARRTIGGFLLWLLRGAMHTAARSTIRTLHAGNPLTPDGYAVLALTIAAVAAIAAFSRLAGSAERGLTPPPGRCEA